MLSELSLNEDITNMLRHFEIKTVQQLMTFTAEDVMDLHIATNQMGGRIHLRVSDLAIIRKELELLQVTLKDDDVENQRCKACGRHHFRSYMNMSGSHRRWICDTCAHKLFRQNDELEEYFLVVLDKAKELGIFKDREETTT